MIVLDRDFASGINPIKLLLVISTARHFVYEAANMINIIIIIYGVL